MHKRAHPPTPQESFIGGPPAAKRSRGATDTTRQPPLRSLSQPLQPAKAVSRPPGHLPPHSVHLNHYAPAGSFTSTSTQQNQESQHLQAQRIPQWPYNPHQGNLQMHHGVATHPPPPFHTTTAHAYAWSTTNQPFPFTFRATSSNQPPPHACPQDERVRELERQLESMTVQRDRLANRVLELEELQQSQPSTKPPESTEPLTHAFTGLESDVLGLTRPVAPLPKKSKKSKKSKKAKKDPKPDCAKGQCACPPGREERTRVQPRPRQGWRFPTPCGVCDCCRTAYSAHCSSHIPKLKFPPLLRFSESAEGKALRKQVFTSKSAAPAHNFRLSYEPLEQLGDGILEMTTRLLIHDEYDELTWKRRQDIKVRIVKNETLGLVSRHYALRDMLLTGKKNAGDCADSPTKVDADVFEAFLGGLLKDRGYKKTRNWIRDVIEPILIWLNSQMEAELLVF